MQVSHAFYIDSCLSVCVSVCEMPLIASYLHHSKEGGVCVCTCKGWRMRVLTRRESKSECVSARERTCLCCARVRVSTSTYRTTGSPPPRALRALLHRHRSPQTQNRIKVNNKLSTNKYDKFSQINQLPIARFRVQNICRITAVFNNYFSFHNWATIKSILFMYFACVCLA